MLKQKIDVEHLWTWEENDLLKAYQCKKNIEEFKSSHSLPENITDLYICCSKGGSRSTGCAAALMLMSGRSDDDVWKNPYYTPNFLVFREMCREFGIDMPDEAVEERLRINDEAFRNAQKNKNGGKYERWQILW